MVLTLFCVLFLGLVLAELIKGLSANGTPPVLQKLPGQLHVAYFLWTYIGVLRIAFAVVLIGLFVLAPMSARWIMLGIAVPLGLLWFGIYWFFTKIWNGRVKFPPLERNVFAGREGNTVDPKVQVIGVDYGGEQKAFPTNMITFHHQVRDQIGGLPIWVTYCGLCRSGRIYNLDVEGGPFDFSLVGAITFNATFADKQTGTWWRQETGEAAIGKLKGRVLPDVPTEQMTLANWLEKYPEGQVLQYDEQHKRRYTFIAKLHSFEATKPAWHMHVTPPLIVGVELEGVAKAYDLEQLKTAGVVSDAVGERAIVIAMDPARTSAIAYSRDVEGRVLNFSATEQGMSDAQTGSTWDWFGRCLDGDLKGTTLTQLQSYQQFVRAWIAFHPDTTFYDFG